MKVIVEKKIVVGVLKTSSGIYNLLGLIDAKVERLGTFSGAVKFHVIDAEGFENWIWVSGPFDVVPSIVGEMMDVKIIRSEEEVLPTDKIVTFATIDE